MANYSNSTRKDQVFNYLRTRINDWVNGTDLANEQVGGSEGLKRLRELRKDLTDSRFDIEMRPHPDPARDIYQYRLVERPLAAPPVQTPPDPPYEPPPVVEAPKPTFDADRRGPALAYDPATDTYITIYDGPPIQPTELETPVPGQSDMGVPTEDGLKYSKKPERVDFGTSRPCPKCHGVHRSITEIDPKTKKAVKVFNGVTGKLINKVIGYEDYTRNPSKPSEECPRCNGFGLIPA